MLQRLAEPLGVAPQAALRASRTSSRDVAVPSSAAVLDSSLARLAHLEAHARCELGRVARRFLSLGGHHRLGFSRVGDYSRERLGVSGRELESFAFVAAKLAGFTHLARAFRRGEISWSQTRLLCSVADRDSEVDWLERARSMTVRELVAAIRQRSSSGAMREVEEALEAEADSTDGEPRVRFSILCPGRVALLWRKVVELARRMIGSQAPVWQAAEAVVAEASSAAAIEPEETADTDPLPREVIPLIARPALEELESEPEASLESADEFALDLEMRELVDSLDSIDVDLGKLLRRVVDLRIHRALGFSSFELYVQERLGISPAKARALVAVERRTKDSPELARAYGSGALSWVKALAILPVTGDSHASAWIARAQEVTVRRLQDEVEWALDMRDAYGAPTAPPESGVRLERPDLQTCARPDRELADQRVTFFGPASVIGLFRAGVSGLAEPNEPQWKGLERLLLHAIGEWEAQPRHRDPIFSRDGWRCSVPACTGRRSLEDHHIVFRSRGGGNEQWNRLAVCAAHHHHAVHRYVIRASGRAPDDVTWELGLRPGQAPLAVLYGERYLRIFDN